MSNLNPRYKLDGGYPYVEIDYLGRVAQIFTETKPWVFDAGYIRLGDDFLELSATVEGEELRGFTNDPEVMAVYVKFREDLVSGEFRNKLIS